MAPSSLVGRVAWWVAFIAATVAWLIPNHYPPWTSYYNEVAMAVALAALTCAVLPGRILERVPGPAWFVLAVAFLPWLQYATGLLRYSGDAFVASAYVVALATSVVVGHFASADDEPRLALTLSSAAVTAALVSAVLAVTQSLQLASWGLWAEFASSDMRAVGNLAQPNNFSTLLGLGALGLFHLYERGKVQRIPAFALAALLVAANALAQSRVSLVFGVIVLAALWLLRRRSVALRTPAAAVIALTLLHWLLMWITPLVLGALFDQSPQTFGARSVGMPRYAMWGLLIDAVGLAPWQGYGWLQVGAAELAVVDAYPNVRELWLQAHNVFVELIVSNGWPLGLFLGGALIYWYVSRVRQVRSLDAMIGMLVVSFFGVHALVELSYHYAYFLIPVGLWAGIVERQQLRRTIGDARWFIAPVLATVVVVVGIVVDYGPVEEDFRRVRFANARIGGLHVAEPVPEALFLSSLTAFLAFARTEPVPGMSPAQLREMQESVSRYPYAASLVRYASALALNGRLDEGRRTFVKIRWLYGDKIYVLLKNDLRDKVADGQSALAALDRALPPVESLRR